MTWVAESEVSWKTFCLRTQVTIVCMAGRCHPQELTRYVHLHVGHFIDSTHQIILIGLVLEPGKIEKQKSLGGEGP